MRKLELLIPHHVVPELLIPRMYGNWLLKYSDHTVKSIDDKIIEYGNNCQSCGGLVHECSCSHE
jgi:hypothetical protein